MNYTNKNQHVGYINYQVTMEINESCNNTAMYSYCIDYNLAYEQWEFQIIQVYIGRKKNDIQKKVKYCSYVPKYIAVLIVHKVHTHENYNEKV